MRAAYLLSPSFITRGRMGEARQLSFWWKTLILIGHYSSCFYWLFVAATCWKSKVITLLWGGKATLVSCQLHPQGERQWKIQLRHNLYESLCFIDPSFLNFQTSLLQKVRSFHGASCTETPARPTMSLVFHSGNSALIRNMIGWSILRSLFQTRNVIL